MLQALTALTIAVLGWAFRLEGRSKELFVKYDANKELIFMQHTAIKELLEAKFDGIDTRLERIERSLNGHLVKD